MPNDRYLYGKLTNATPISTYTPSVNLAEGLNRLEKPINTIEEYSPLGLNAIESENDLAIKNRFKTDQDNTINSLAGSDPFIAASATRKAARDSASRVANVNSPEGRVKYNYQKRQENLDLQNKRKDTTGDDPTFSELFNKFEYDRSGGAGTMTPSGVFIPNDYTTRNNAPALFDKEKKIKSYQEGFEARQVEGKTFADAFTGDGYITKLYSNYKDVSGNRVASAVAASLQGDTEWKERTIWEQKKKLASESLNRGESQEQASANALGKSDKYWEEFLIREAGKEAGIAVTKKAFEVGEKRKSKSADSEFARGQEELKTAPLDITESYGAVRSLNTIGSDRKEVAKTISERRKSTENILKELKKKAHAIDPEGKLMLERKIGNTKKIVSEGEFKEAFGRTHSDSRLNEMYKEYSNAVTSLELAEEFDKQVKDNVQKKLGLSEVEMTTKGKKVSDYREIIEKYPNVFKSSTGKFTPSGDNKEKLFIKLYKDATGSVPVTVGDPSEKQLAELKEASIESYNDYMILDDFKKNEKDLEKVLNSLDEEIGERQSIEIADWAKIPQLYKYERDSKGNLNQVQDITSTKRLLNSLDKVISTEGLANKLFIDQGNFINGKDAYQNGNNFLKGKKKFKFDNSPVEITTLPIVKDDKSPSNIAYRKDYSYEDDEGNIKTGTILIPSSEIRTEYTNQLESSPIFKVSSLYQKGASSGLDSWDVSSHLSEYFPNSTVKFEYEKLRDGKSSEGVYIKTKGKEGKYISYEDLTRALNSVNTLNSSSK